MSTPYTDREQIEQIYGANNVKRWADLDNKANEENIAAVIDYAIQRAEIHVDGRLTDGPYPPPYSDPLPREVAYLTALKAGLLLFNGRQIVSNEETTQVSQQAEEFDTIIRQVHSRQFHFSGMTPVSKEYPFQVS